MSPYIHTFLEQIWETEIFFFYEIMDSGHVPWEIHCSYLPKLLFFTLLSAQCKWTNMHNLTKLCRWNGIFRTCNFKLVTHLHCSSLFEHQDHFLLYEVPPLWHDLCKGTIAFNLQQSLSRRCSFCRQRESSLYNKLGHVQCVMTYHKHHRQFIVSKYF